MDAGRLIARRARDTGMKTALLLLFLPALLLGQTAPIPPAYSCAAPVAVATDVRSCLLLRDISRHPLAGDSLEIRVWHDVTVSGVTMVRLVRARGTWTAQSYTAQRWGRTVEVDTVATSQSWDDGYRNAVTAGMLNLPRLPTSTDPVPRSAGEWFALEWSTNGTFHEALSNTPASCHVPSDRHLIDILLTLGAISQGCPSH
jgi:hypothetical protein